MMLSIYMAACVIPITKATISYDEYLEKGCQSKYSTNSLCLLAEFRKATIVRDDPFAQNLMEDLLTFLGGKDVVRKMCYKNISWVDFEAILEICSQDNKDHYRDYFEWTGV